MSIIADLTQIVTDPASLVSVAVGAVVFFIFTAVGLQVFQGDKLNTRLKSVANRREQLRRQSRAELEGKSLKRESKGLLSDLDRKFDLQKMLEDPNVEANLQKAGLRGPGPVSAFYAARLILPFIFALLTFVAVFVLHIIEIETPVYRYGSLLFAAGAGFYLPNVYVSNIGAKRQQSIMRAFPDALDLMLICVESGMSIEVAFQKVGREIGSSSVELLGDALRVMAKENRDLRMSAAEKKAAALPAKLTVPMILFFLPVLFIVVIGPAVIKLQANAAARGEGG